MPSSQERAATVMFGTSEEWFLYTNGNALSPVVHATSQFLELWHGRRENI